MLTKFTWLLSLITLCVLLISFREKFYSSQPPPNYTGAPDGNGYCSSCHSNLNSGGGSVTLNGLPSNFQPGQTYSFSVTITHPSPLGRWGFAVNARNGGGAPAGTFSSTNPNAAINGSSAELSHLNAVSFSGTTYTYSNLQWTAPATIGTGDNRVTFYVAGVAANSDGGTSGDFVYSNTRLFLLPINLKDVDVRVVENFKVRIEWATVSENNSKEFIVEKSDDNVNFYEAGRVAAAGNSTGEKAYNFTDAKPSLFNRPVYYRLKMVDADGKFKHSKTFPVVLNAKATHLYSLTPNPATDYVMAGIAATKAEGTDVTIASIAGQVVKRQTLSLQTGNTMYKISLDNLQPGMYYLRFTTKKQAQSIGFLVR